LSLPLLADVPPIRGGKKVVAGSPSANGKRHGEIDERVVCHYRPKSREAEAIRGLRTALCFSTCRGGQKVIQVASPNMGDGKTTISSNLAVSLAQSGKKVLLVDADMRRPMLATIFGIESSAVGLSCVIVGGVKWTDAIRDVGIANLSILPAGATPPNPAELLLSPGFEQFLAAVREQYDYVLIDSPPVLAVSDATVIAARTDGVVLTIRVTTNAAPSALQAKRMLDSVDAKTLGIIVNGFQKDRNYGYGCYGRGERGYGYGYRNASYKNGNSHYYPEDNDSV
jgi:capsular exopolysaccharide synthesis family protein